MDVRVHRPDPAGLTTARGGDPAEVSRTLVAVSGLQIFAPKATLFKLAVGCMALIAGGLWLFQTSTNLFRRSASVVAIVFFGVGLIVLLLRLVRRAPVLEIDSLGVTDRSSLLPAGLLRWDEISSVKIYTIELHSHGRTIERRFLGVHPRAGAVDNLAHPLRRLVQRLNRRAGYTPISIAESALPFSLEELVDQMQRYHPALNVRW
jgi:hypothetical protein